MTSSPKFTMRIPAKDKRTYKKQAHDRGFKALATYIKHLLELDRN